MFVKNSEYEMASKFDLEIVDAGGNAIEVRLYTHFMYCNCVNLIESHSHFIV